MAMLDPTLAILDETDSGLDIDALRIVASGVNSLRTPERSMIVVTHYQRLLNYIVPDFLHVLVEGRIALVRGQGARARARGEGLRLAREGAAREDAARPGLVMEAVAEETRTTGLERSLGDAYREKRSPGDPRWLAEIRRAGMDRFRDMGFPTVHDEAWRYTNVAPIRKVPFELAVDRRRPVNALTPPLSRGERAFSSSSSTAGIPGRSLLPDLGPPASRWPA